MMSGSAVFFVAYREGIDLPLEAGEEVDGKLIIYWDSEKESTDLVCKRTLKH